MTENKRPVFKTQSGRFQVSIWRQDRIVPGRGDWEAERVDVRYRACIQLGKWNRLTHKWENQTIWCSIGDLRSLVTALDELNSAPGVEIPVAPDAVSVGPGN